MSDEAEQIRDFLNLRALPGPMDIPWANEAAGLLVMAAELIDYQDRLVKNLRNMAEYNDRREFGTDYKDDIHWKAADRIEELERLNAVLFWYLPEDVTIGEIREKAGLSQQEEGDE